MALFYFVVATFPFALYMLMIAWFYACSKPRVISGQRDLFVLFLSMSGVFFIGPGQLMVSWGAAAVWGKYAWLLIATLILLFLWVVVSNLRSRLIVYNISTETLRKTLTKVALELDDEACWSGAALNMPGLGVQFYLDPVGLGRVATLTRIGSDRNSEPWNRFAKALVVALKDAPATKKAKVFGACYGILGAFLLGADAFCVFLHHDALREAASFYLSL